METMLKLLAISTFNMSVASNADIGPLYQLLMNTKFKIEELIKEFVYLLSTCCLGFKVGVGGFRIGLGGRMGRVGTSGLTPPGSLGAGLAGLF